MELAFAILDIVLEIGLLIWLCVDTWKVFRLMHDIEQTMKKHDIVTRRQLAEFQLKGFEALFILGVLIWTFK